MAAAAAGAAAEAPSPVAKVMEGLWVQTLLKSHIMVGQPITAQ